MSHQTILVLDFGSQFTQLIARRLRELSVYCEILPFNTPVAALKAKKPIGLILSGGPSSVDEDGAPHCDRAVLDMGIPTLGICYGMQLMTDMLGGKLARSGHREFGHALVRRDDAIESRMLKGMPSEMKVWASHGDFVAAAPPGFAVAASSNNAPVAVMEAPERGYYALLFHPEVAHTDRGKELLRNFAFDVCGCTGDWTIKSFIDEATTRIKEQVGSARVVCGLSGGVDSTVAASLIHRAIGDRLQCIFVDNGLLRLNEAQQVVERYKKLKLPVHHVDASSTFLDRLAGVTDPEKKRKIIGKTFIDVFNDKAAELGDFAFLAQGTLYPDVIESVSVRGPSATIKSHHNVGGLPEGMQFKLVEPLRELFKDEVRAVGRDLGIDKEFLVRQPFPGPGLAVRILGDITHEKVELLQKADKIFIDELRTSGLYKEVWQAFAVLLPIQSVGVMGDYRTYEKTVALRAVNSTDGMTADWARLPHDFLAKVSSRITSISGVTSTSTVGS